jgi:predicted amidohydrolase
MKATETADGGGTVRLALCQVETHPWDLDGNTERLLASIRDAGSQGAELAVTPECAFHGYGDAGSGDRERLASAAETTDGPRFRAVAQAAQSAGIDVVLGFAERASDGRLHNSAALIGRDGGMVYLYRKVHCRPFESDEHDGCFTPGDAFRVADRPYAAGSFRVGTMVCFDREIPESVRCLRSLGAHLVVCPLATNTYDIARAEGSAQADNEVITRCRAAENEVFIAVVNHAGRFNGGSFVVGPRGECLCQLGAEPQTRVVDVPLGTVRERFHSEPLGWMGWGYRRPQVYRDYLSEP